jgi:hypothetical protein
MKSDTNIADTIEQHLKPLIGLPFSEFFRACDMAMFRFGVIDVVDGACVCDYALHVQCTRRLQNEERIIAGRHDLFDPAEETENFDWDSWDWTEGSETRLDRHMRDLFLLDEVKASDGLIVEDVRADAYGGATLSLSHGYALVLFPAATADEDWRLLSARTDGPHFVISGGRIEGNETE